MLRFNIIKAITNLFRNPAKGVFGKMLAKAQSKGVDIQNVKQSTNWWKNNANLLGGLTTETIIAKNKAKVGNSPAVGKLNMFIYDAKTKDDLPYWDAAPLSLILEATGDGFVGLNFHYLSPSERALLLDVLMILASDDQMDEQTRIVTTYSVLNSASKFKMFRPTYKRYLYRHVRSKFLEVDATEWPVALFMPTERFQKKDKQYVWSESRKIYQGKKTSRK